MGRCVRVTAMTAVVFVMGLPGMALAAERDAGANVGTNLGKLLSSWGSALYWGIGCIVALGLLMNRKFADLAVFGVIAIAVGGMFFAHSSVQDVISGMWKALAG